MGKAILMSARQGACFALITYSAVVVAALIACQLSGL
jgi:hypothetical protein